MKKKIISIFLICVMLLQTACAAKTQSVDVSNNVNTARDNVLTDLPTEWDMTDLFADEAVFEAEIKHAIEQLAELDSLRGTLNSVEGILSLLEHPAITEAMPLLRKAYVYSELYSSLDASDTLARKVTATYAQLDKEYRQAIAFADAEIMELPLEKRMEIFSDERLAPYAYYMRRFTDPDFAVLSEETAKAQSLIGWVSNQQEAYNALEYVDREIPAFTYPDGKEGALTESEYSKIVNDKNYDQDFRQKIDRLRNSSRASHINTYAALLDGKVRGNVATARLNGYDSVKEYMLHEADVAPEMYDKVIDFANSLIPKYSAYFDKKRDILGLDKLFVFERYMSAISYDPGELSYEDAVNVGRDAISVWGDEYLEIFDKIITSPHVDVYPSDTKSAGGWESDPGAQMIPYVMFNFDGTTEYTVNIVHEMGHAVYAYMSTNNQNMYNDYPVIFTHETASTANEIMCLKYMIDNSKTDEERLYWLGYEIDRFMSLLLMQCLYSEFEDYCYKTVESGGALDSDTLNKKWLELYQKYFGDSLIVNEESGVDWARIAHFYSVAYYVYNYAASTTCALSVCELVDTKGEDEIAAYIEFLKRGRSADPVTLLTGAGVNPLDDKTYEFAGKYIGGLIDEYLALAK